MKGLLLVYVVLLLASFNSFCQTKVEKVLKEIENNNSYISALKKQAESEKMSNKSGIYLQNPELELGFLFGSPGVAGNRTDISLVQSFDFPSTYFHKKKIADLSNNIIDIAFSGQIREILHDARILLVELTYYNAICSEIKRKRDNALLVSDLYKEKIEKGDATAIDFNKSRMSLNAAEMELRQVEIIRSGLISKLSLLNAGNQIEYNDTIYDATILSVDFETWFTGVEKNIPELSILDKELVRSEAGEKLAKAQGLPKFSAGYSSERTIGEHFQGVSVGISIPLWENKNNVKQARLKSESLQQIGNSKKAEFKGVMKAKYDEYMSLKETVAKYSQSLKDLSNLSLLNFALKSGAITMIDYLFELSFYYDSRMKLLEAEKSLNLSITELMRYM